MTISPERARRDAKALKKAFAMGEAAAQARVGAVLPDAAQLAHADALHVVAREAGFDSWPKLKFASQAAAMDRAARLERLKIALFHGQGWVAERLLADDPGLAVADPGIIAATYGVEALRATLARDPGAATRASLGPRTPILHLAFSRHLHARPGQEAAMLATAELLLAHGADVNDGFAVAPGSAHRLSALYGAIGHADNMALGRWLLDHGADPNDGESLYHATELGHHRGLRMLLEAGADPAGTNALLRAMDFHDIEAVQMLLAAGAQADEFNNLEVGGESPWVVPALHQAARRMCDRRMCELLLDAGADPARVFQGAAVYPFARVFGNADLAAALEARGMAAPLDATEALLAQAAEGAVPKGVWVDPARLQPAYRDILRTILHLPGKLGHVERLVALGVEYDRPDAEGLTPVQVAGWEGLPEVMGYFLRLKPDLSHVNGYGGRLLSTIIHGSENCPDRARRDHLACAELALEEGVALPQGAIELAGVPEMAEFLDAWAERHPGQVVAEGPV